MVGQWHTVIKRNVLKSVRFKFRVGSYRRNSYGIVTINNSVTERGDRLWVRTREPEYCTNSNLCAQGPPRATHWHLRLGLATAALNLRTASGMLRMTFDITDWSQGASVNSVKLKKNLSPAPKLISDWTVKTLILSPGVAESSSCTLWYRMNY